MGSSASKEKVAPLWTSERGFYGATAESRIKDLSASASAFLKPHPAGTRGGVEDLEAAEVRAMLERATRHDPRISLIWLPRLVPKR